MGYYNESLVISREEVSILKGNSISDKYFKKLVVIENGLLVELNGKKEKSLNDDPLFLRSLNILDKNSIVKPFINLLEQEKNFVNADFTVLFALLSICILGNNLVVELNKEDIHTDYISNKLNKSKYSNEKIFNSLLQDVIESSMKDFILSLSTAGKDRIKVDNFNDYEKNIKGLTDFIRIFKPDLDEIEIDKVIDNDNYYCDKVFRYGDNRVNVEFESTGIKKLVRLYSVLKECANGSITFIDEMDANLHDVYFAKIIEFFKNDGMGQLCFTTHNLEPINILKDNSYSLDFISNDSRVYSWKKDGNKSPLNKYVNGLIPYSPFNVDSFDFDVLLKDEALNKWNN